MKKKSSGANETDLSADVLQEATTSDVDRGSLGRGGSTACRRAQGDRRRRPALQRPAIDRRVAKVAAATLWHKVGGDDEKRRQKVPLPLAGHRPAGGRARRRVTAAGAARGVIPAAAQGHVLLSPRGLVDVRVLLPEGLAPIPSGKGEGDGEQARVDDRDAGVHARLVLDAAGRHRQCGR